MLLRFIFALFAFVVMAASAEARRVALVIGQDAYLDSDSATIGLAKLYNSGNDARSVSAMLAAHGFDVIACEGKSPGCYDLDRTHVLAALSTLETRAKDADAALVYFAGHGLASDEGNILTPVDAKVNCATGAITNGIPVERFMQAIAPAKNKLMILDACRDNPIGDVCPGLKGKSLSFTRIEAGALQGFLLVTSTQFGQRAKDGPHGTHSPFAAAMLKTLESNPAIYFEQVFNEVARETYEAAQKHNNFQQIPGKVVGGAAPADCLAGKDCIGDVRMAALAIENEKLAADANGVRNILATEEQARGKPYTAEERAKRVADLGATLARIGTSSNPLRQEAKRLIDGGNVAGGEAKLDEALDADEKAVLEAERVATEKRKAAANSARDLAVLARGRDVLKAIAYYQRAMRLDPASARTWLDYADVAVDAGRLDLAKTAFEQAFQKARNSNDPDTRYWAMLRLGDMALEQGGSVSSARQLFETALAIVEPIAKSDPGNSVWQYDLGVGNERIGSVLASEGNLSAALKSYEANRDIVSRLVAAEPSNADWQGDLSVSYEKIGNVLAEQGNQPAALKSYRDSLALRERLANADPGNARWLRYLWVAHGKIGQLLFAQGKLSEALKSYRDAFAILDRAAKSDSANYTWQGDLSVLYRWNGDVLVAQGNLPEALKSYRDSLAIADRIARADYAGWQEQLSLSYAKVGDVLVAQGNLPEALKLYRDSLTIAERLAKSDAGNAGWQRDLSVSHNKIGDVLVEQGNLPAALAAYKASHDIFDRLAKSDPGNARWQRDLAQSYGRLAKVQAQQGARDDARRNYRQARDILVRLKAQSPDNATLAKDLAFYEARIAELDK